MRRPSDEPRAQAQRRAQQKYRQSAQGAWIINTEAFGVRPIDLVARTPDRLREFATLNEAVQFELECYDARQQNPARYQTIPKKNLDLPTEQRALATSVQTAVTEARDHLVDNQAREADALHARHDQTQGELRSLRASVDARVEVKHAEDSIKQHVTDEIQKLQRHHSTSVAYHVDHAAIRTSLERGGFTAAQLLSLHTAANLPLPMRVNASGISVPEKVKYQLAQNLCSAAGSGEHVVEAAAASSSSDEVPTHIFSYATLNSWMDALRHQRPVAEWEPRVHSALLEPAPKKRRKGATKVVTALLTPPPPFAKEMASAGNPATQQVNAPVHTTLSEGGASPSLGDLYEKLVPSSSASASTAAGELLSPISSNSSGRDVMEEHPQPYLQRPNVGTWHSMLPAAEPPLQAKLKASAQDHAAWYEAAEQDDVRVVCSLEQALPRASLERVARDFPRNVHLADIRQLSCAVVEHNGQYRILPAECLEPPPAPVIGPFHCLPSADDIEFELALFSATFGKHKAAEQRRFENAEKEIHVIPDEHLCQFEVKPGRPCWRVKPCCAAHGGPGVQCGSVLEFEPEMRCIKNAVDGQLFCVSHAPAPNLGPLMHEAFLEHEAAPTAKELEQFCNEHYPDGNHAEIQCRVETFCDRIRDGKRRRTS